MLGAVKLVTNPPPAAVTCWELPGPVTVIVALFGKYEPYTVIVCPGA